MLLVEPYDHDFSNLLRDLMILEYFVLQMRLLEHLPFTLSCGCQLLHMRESALNYLH